MRIDLLKTEMLNLVFEIALLVLFAIGLIAAIRVGWAWQRIYGEVENRGARIFAYVFPVFIFKRTSLTRRGQALRRQIIINFTILTLCIAVPIVIWLVAEQFIPRT